jgi:hypothetical protein
MRTKGNKFGERPGNTITYVKYDMLNIMSDIFVLSITCHLIKVTKYDCFGLIKSLILR